MTSDKPMVSICIMTYNHEKWIAQAIESALMQKTNFPFKIVIGEDCSTDKTREIVKRYAEQYPNKIKALLHLKNLGPPHSPGRNNFLSILKQYSSKYIAMLEGDDYWTDPFELQKQVDFLEAHPDFGLVHSDYDVLREKNRKLIKAINKFKQKQIPQGAVFEDLLVDNFIATCTVCFRRKLLSIDILRIGQSRKWLIGDRPLWMEISRHAKIGYIDESLATHRILTESAQHTKDAKKQYNFFKSSYDIRFYYMEKYGCSENTTTIVTNDYHKGMLKHSFNLRNVRLAKTHYSYLANKDDGNESEYFLYYHGSKNLLSWFLVKVCFKIRRKLSNNS